jgi:light-regulated signal transduction histidine kinase (bacteriophytochrome)
LSERISDIPEQARELYTRKLLGFIPDVSYSPVPLLALEQGPPLDMSLCVLRSVSPVHLEYLRNMQVAATLTISLVIYGKLWGMIACHHGKPRFGRTLDELLIWLVASSAEALYVTHTLPQLFPPAVDWKARASGLLSVPFDPNKIPILFVHGLISSPISWQNLTNDLCSPF